jgi:lysozyme
MTDRKPVADAFRTFMGGRLTKAETDALDAFLDQFRPRAAITLGDAWVDLAAPLIEEFEGYAKKLPDGGVQAYPDPGTGGKPWTIGIGSTTNENGQPIAPGTVWTRERAVARFKAHLAEFGEGVNRLLAGKPATPAQKAALTSLAYNIGLGALSRSTVLKRHLAGDYDGAAKAFHMWNKAAGKVMAGLTRRRVAEATLYRSGQ